MRLIDADELKKRSDITNWDKPYGCSFDVIDNMPTINAVVITDIKKHKSNFDDLELTEEFVHEQLDSYTKTLNNMNKLDVLSK